MSAEYEAKLKETVLGMNLPGMDDHLSEMIAHAFTKFDEKEEGFIDVSSLRLTFAACDLDIPGFKLREIQQKWKLKTSGEVTFEEFARKSIELHKDIKSFDHKIRNQVDAAEGLQQVVRNKSKEVGHRLYEIEERVGFADWLNRMFKKDPDCTHLLPIDGDNEELFDKMSDGILLCKLINSAIKDTIDDRAINKPKNGRVDEFRSTENINLGLNSAKSIGCTVVNIGQGDIKEGRGHLVLALLWQIIEIGLTAGISLENHPNLACLLDEDEDISILQRMSPEQILLRWVNYQLRKDPKYEAGPITNFKKDIKDSVAYTHLLAVIQPEEMYPRISNDTSANSDMERAEKMLKNADRLDCRAFVTPRDIVKGHEKLNLAFVANLFNNHPALEDVDIEVIQETREEKTYRNWMNSLGVNPKIRKLYYDIEDGQGLLHVMDQIKPGIVNKKMVNKGPFKQSTAMLKKLENLNYAVKIGNDMGYSLVGVAGSSIYEKNDTLTLALIWQMMRSYTVKVCLL
jgi:hypothetical protein